MCWPCSSTATTDPPSPARARRAGSSRASPDVHRRCAARHRVDRGRLVRRSRPDGRLLARDWADHARHLGIRTSSSIRPSRPTGARSRMPQEPRGKRGSTSGRLREAHRPADGRGLGRCATMAAVVARRLDASCSRAVVSPNSRVVTSSGGMLYRGACPRRRTAEAPRLSVPGGLAWSARHGRPTAHESSFGGSTGCTSSSAEGRASHDCSSAGSDVHSPRWSPDGTRIAFVNRGSIFTFGEESLGNVSTSTVMVLDGRQPPDDQDHERRLARHEPRVDAGQPDPALCVEPRGWP